MNTYPHVLAWAVADAWLSLLAGALGLVLIGAAQGLTAGRRTPGRVLVALALGLAGVTALIASGLLAVLAIGTAWRGGWIG